MDIADHLQQMLIDEDAYLKYLTERTNAMQLPLSADAEQKLRMGFRTKSIIDLAWNRHIAGLDPVTGKPKGAGTDHRSEA